MSYNIIFRHSDYMANKMWQTAKKLVPIDTNEILTGKISLLENVFMGKAIAGAMRIQHFESHLNGLL